MAPLPPSSEGRQKEPSDCRAGLPCSTLNCTRKFKFIGPLLPHSPHPELGSQPQQFLKAPSTYRSLNNLRDWKNGLVVSTDSGLEFVSQRPHQKVHKCLSLKLRWICRPLWTLWEAEHVCIHTHINAKILRIKKNSPTVTCSGPWHWLLVSVMLWSQKAYSVLVAHFPFPVSPTSPSLYVCRVKQAPLLHQLLLKWHSG